MATMWGRPAPPLGRSAYCSPIYKNHSFLVALDLKHISKPTPMSEIPVLNFVIENSLGRSSFGVREKSEKVKSKSVVKILSKRKRGAVKI